MYKFLFSFLFLVAVQHQTCSIELDIENALSWLQSKLRSSPEFTQIAMSMVKGSSGNINLGSDLALDYKAYKCSIFGLSFKRRTELERDKNGKLMVTKRNIFQDFSEKLSGKLFFETGRLSSMIADKVASFGKKILTKMGLHVRNLERRGANLDKRSFAQFIRFELESRINELKAQLEKSLSSLGDQFLDKIKIPRFRRNLSDKQHELVKKNLLEGIRQQLNSQLATITERIRLQINGFTEKLLGQLKFKRSVKQAGENDHQQKRFLQNFANQLGSELQNFANKIKEQLTPKRECRAKCEEKKYTGISHERKADNPADAVRQACEATVSDLMKMLAEQR